MRSLQQLLATVVVLVLCSASAARTQPTAADCQATQLAELRRAVQCRGKAFQRAVRRQVAPDAGRCSERLVTHFAAATAQYGIVCPREPSAADLDSTIDAFLANALAVTSPALSSKCTALTLKLLAARIGRGLRARQRLAGRDDLDRYRAELEAAETRRRSDLDVRLPKRGCSLPDGGKVLVARAHALEAALLAQLSDDALAFRQAACPSALAPATCAGGTSATCHAAYVQGTGADACRTGHGARAEQLVPADADPGDGGTSRAWSFAVRPQGRTFATLYDVVTGALRADVEIGAAAGTTAASGAAHLRLTTTAPETRVVVLRWDSSDLAPQAQAELRVLSGGEPIVQTTLGFGSPQNGVVVQTIRWTGALDLEVGASVEVARDAAGESAELTWSLAALAATADDDGDGTVNLLDQQPLDAVVPQAVTRPVRPRVLLIGLDGAGWDTLDPLIAGGYLPNLAALVDAGARAEIDETTANPAYCCFCPPQWASLVTGVDQPTHKMNVYESEPFDRGAAALWKALAADGGSYTTINFRGTFPAEPGTTYSISEPTLTAVAHDLYGGWGAQVTYAESANHLQGSWPPGLFESLGLATAPAEPWPPAYVPMTADRLAYEALSRLNELDVSDLTMWLYHSPDKSMHLAWELVQPTALDPVDGAALQALGAAWTGPVVGPIDPLYWGDPASQLLEVDAYVGALAASPGYDYFVFVSDHSMARNAGFGLAGVHGPDYAGSHDGIFSITGPGVAAGADLGVISLLDVAPTLAYVLAVPIADDLPGGLLVDAFTADHLAAVPVLSIPHWR